MIFKCAQVFVMHLCHILTNIHIYVYTQEGVSCFMIKEIDKRQRMKKGDWYRERVI